MKEKVKICEEDILMECLQLEEGKNILILLEANTFMERASIIQSMGKPFPSNYRQTLNNAIYSK